MNDITQFRDEDNIGMRKAIILYEQDKQTKIPNPDINESYYISNNIFSRYSDSITKDNKLSYLTNTISAKVYDASMLISREYTTAIDMEYKTFGSIEFINNIKNIIFESDFFSPNRISRLINININDINNHIVGTLPRMLNNIFEYTSSRVSVFRVEHYTDFKNCIIPILKSIESISISYLYSIIQYMNQVLIL